MITSKYDRWYDSQTDRGTDDEQSCPSLYVTICLAGTTNKGIRVQFKRYLIYGLSVTKCRTWRLLPYLHWVTAEGIHVSQTHLVLQVRRKSSWSSSWSEDLPRLCKQTKNIDMCLWSTSNTPGCNIAKIWQSPPFWPRPIHLGHVMPVKCE